jgi:hypothetical protein
MKQSVWGSLALGFAVATSVALTGCCGKKGTSGSSSGSTAEKVTIAEAGVKFNAPAGWSKKTDGDWVKFSPSDNFATLGFVVFDRPNESTRRIGEMVRQLNLAGPPAWAGSNTPTSIGPNALPAQTAHGSCKMTNGDPCLVEYFTVNPGGSNQLLIVYAVNTAKGAAHKANASAAVRSLSKI